TAPRTAAASARPAPATVAAQPTAQPATPPGQQDPETIRRAALAFLQQQIAGLPGKTTATVTTAFPRGLAACTTLEPFLPTGARLWGRTTVGVRCAGERPWTVYLQAKVAVQATYYVAARQIAPGEPLSAADLVARDGDLTVMPLAVITDPAQAIGATALARISAGLPLRQDMLKSAASVSAGQTVRVVAAGPGFTISAEGSVLANAAPGQSVRVRMAAGQIVTAIVKDAGTVEIPL
ncbi:flagellar basal body P-ring formation chaperone FlgA, partial [Burkholderia cenocepacia]